MIGSMWCIWEMQSIKGYHEHADMCVAVCIPGTPPSPVLVVACIQRGDEATGVQGQGLTARGLRGS